MYAAKLLVIILFFGIQKAWTVGWVLVDSAMIVDDQFNHSVSLFRAPNDMFAYWQNYSGPDTLGNEHYQRRYEVVYCFEQNPNDSVHNWSQMQFFEWVQELKYSRFEGGLRYANIIMGPKQRQESPILDESDGRVPCNRDTCDFIIQSSVGVRGSPLWTRIVRPWQTNHLIVNAFRSLSLEQGNFRYITVHFWANFPCNIGCNSDTLRVRMTEGNCQRSSWSWQYHSRDIPADSSNLSQFPLIPFSLSETGDPENPFLINYSICFDSLNIPQGNYAVRVYSGQNELISQYQSENFSRSVVFPLSFNLTEIDDTPSYVILEQGSFHPVFYLQPLDFYPIFHP